MRNQDRKFMVICLKPNQAVWTGDRWRQIAIADRFEIHHAAVALYSSREACAVRDDTLKYSTTVDAPTIAVVEAKSPYA